MDDTSSDRLRISFSAASFWWAGDKDAAIRTMLHEDIRYPVYESQMVRERAMAFGSGFHTALELECNVTNRLPAMFGNQDFTVLFSEPKLTKELPTGDILVGKLDAIAINTDLEMVVLVDYKSSPHFNDRQAEVYHYLTYNHPWWLENVGEFLPTHFFFLTLDKKSHEVDNTIIQLTYPKTDIEWELPDATTYTRGANWICTVAEDIRNDRLAMARLGKVA